MRALGAPMDMQQVVPVVLKHQESRCAVVGQGVGLPSCTREWRIGLLKLEDRRLGLDPEGRFVVPKVSTRTFPSAVQGYLEEGL